ncbi:MAG: hypothetical protein N3F66_12510 [Spirochaetes bacterium]|nr:hypothetical protein [Spirochaetota bacterium]
MKEFFDYSIFGELCPNIFELEFTRSELVKIKNSYTYKIAVKLEKIARKTGNIYPLKWVVKLYKWMFKK